jgi:hypothetical protein
MVEHVLLYTILFGIFVVLQSLAINGIHECFKGSEWKDLNKGDTYSGMIFYPIARWMKRNIKQQWILKPTVDCIKCASSFWGAITYWPIVLIVFGFYTVEILIFIFDMFILVYLNYFFYKKV